MLEPFGPSLYAADGPTILFHGFPFPTRMALAQLSNGSLWVWSPIALTADLEAEVSALGIVRHIVSPSSIHHVFLDEWSRRWPEARVHGPPALARTRPDLQFHVLCTDAGEDRAWTAEIDQALFRGSLASQEVAFFHRPSRTALICDLIQRHPQPEPFQRAGWRDYLMRLDGLMDPRGRTPRLIRASFMRRGQARAARDRVLAWHAERLLIAHGEGAQTNAAAVIETALRWL